MPKGGSKKTDGKSGEMTAQRIKFCEQYVIDHNGTQAAIRAGYAKKSAKVAASRLLTYDNVINKIRELLAEQSKRTAITADAVLEELRRIGFSNIQEFIDDENSVKMIRTIERDKAAAVEAIKVTETVYGRGPDAITKTATTFKLADKLSALDKIMRHLGMFEKDNRQKPATETVVKIMMPDNARTKIKTGK